MENEENQLVRGFYDVKTNFYSRKKIRSCVKNY